nr:hypothetical protein [uncultured bacterium]
MHPDRRVVEETDYLRGREPLHFLLFVVVTRGSAQRLCQTDLNFN